MRKPGRLFLSLAAIVAATTLMAGCVTNFGYGRIQAADRGNSVQDLVNNWQDYHVTYSGLYVNRPSGLMFDPKHDDRELVGNNWRPVQDPATLNEILSSLESNDIYRPRLLRILGPDRTLYGYVYTGWHHVVARPVDPRVMRVLDLPAPLPDDFDAPSR